MELKEALQKLKKAVNSFPKKLHMCLQALRGWMAGGAHALALQPPAPGEESVPSP